MTNLRARLADALADHASTEDGCFCGKDDHLAYDYWARHVADVLLSLPGIAIVDAEDLWDAQQYVQDWRDSDNCDDTPEHRRRLTQLARRLRDAANKAEENK
jgi:hypothetical protein